MDPVHLHTGSSQRCCPPRVAACMTQVFRFPIVRGDSHSGAGEGAGVGMGAVGRTQASSVATSRGHRTRPTDRSSVDIWEEGDDE